MKKIIFIIGLMMISSFAFSGQKEGNGGGVWACKTPSNSFIWIDLVDLYEGREEFHLNIPQRESQNQDEILGEIKERLLSIDKKFGEALSHSIDDIVSSMSFTMGKLTIIDDALYRIRPPESTCTRGWVEYVQLANFTYYQKTLIQKTIWEDEKFSELNKAALIIHEAVYKYARENKGDTNSVRTREAVAHIFSDMDTDGLRLKLSKDGWFKSEPTDPLPDPEKRTTKTGAVFIRDRSLPALGEAWRDPRGLIWGDIIKRADGTGTVRSMNHDNATAYCDSIEARLPTKEEFIQLREYMGARAGTDEGYSHHDNQVLPNLSGHWFWSSSVSPDSADYFYDFSRPYGGVDYHVRNLKNAVRCVVGR